MSDKLPHGYNDGLYFDKDVGAWSATKYRLVHLYASLFSAGMKNKWKERVYIDLYAGAGYARVRNTQKILVGSPLLALSVGAPFDKYIFCERNRKCITALEARVRREAPMANVAFISGDCNTQVDKIVSEIPAASRDHNVLGLCFVDPFDLGIKFQSIKTLSSRYLDFLFLLADMDPSRACQTYVGENSTKVDEFLGITTWRTAWEIERQNGKAFPKFLAEQFALRMETLNYRPQPLYKMKEVRSDEKNTPLYHLALFSRCDQAYKFWDEVLTYSEDQLAIPFEEGTCR